MQAEGSQFLGAMSPLGTDCRIQPAAYTYPQLQFQATLPKGPSFLLSPVSGKSQAIQGNVGSPWPYSELRASMGKLAVLSLEPAHSKPTSLPAPLQLWTRGMRACKELQASQGLGIGRREQELMAPHRGQRSPPRLSSMKRRQIHLLANSWLAENPQPERKAQYSRSHLLGQRLSRQQLFP